MDVRLILALGPPAVLRLVNEVNPLFPWWPAVVAAKKSSNGKGLKPKGENREVAMLFEDGCEWRPVLLRWFPWPFKPTIQKIINRRISLIERKTCKMYQLTSKKICEGRTPEKLSENIFRVTESKWIAEWYIIIIVRSRSSSSIWAKTFFSILVIHPAFPFYKNKIFVNIWEIKMK